MEGEEEDAFLTDILQSLVKMSALVVASSSVIDDDNERLSVDLKILGMAHMKVCKEQGTPQTSNHTGCGED